MPSRGEIWFVQMHTDPPEKGRRPVVIVSLEARNQNPRAHTVLIVPLSTTPKRMPTQVELSPGETGLSEFSTAKAEEITSVPKTWLTPPRTPTRRVGEAKLQQIAVGVMRALGYAT